MTTLQEKAAAGTPNVEPPCPECGSYRRSDEQTLERLYGQIFDLKASLGCLIALMQEDVDSGKVRGTMVRLALIQDARNLSRG